jgi:hypothetical protein
VHGGLGRLHRVVLVVDPRGGTGEVVTLVDLDIEREGHVVAHQLEARIVETSQQVLFGTGEIVVDAQHTSLPSANRPSHRCEPRKPAPPVTKIRLFMSCPLSGLQSRDEMRLGRRH